MTMLTSMQVMTKMMTIMMMMMIDTANDELDGR